MNMPIQISFSKSYEMVYYTLGSGIKTIDLPKMIQKPDCGETINGLKLYTPGHESLQSILNLDIDQNIMTIDSNDMNLAD